MVTRSLIIIIVLQSSERIFVQLAVKKTIHQCIECTHPIKGDYHVDGIICVSSTAVPTHCEKCGKPFPWTTRKKELINSVSDDTEQDSLSLVNQVCSRFHLVALYQKGIRHNKANTLGQ